MRPITILTVALLLESSAFPQQQTPTFSTTTNIVVVDVTVTRDGKPLDNLTPDDFLVYEDGKLQRLKSCELQRMEDKPLPPLPEVAPKALIQRPSAPVATGQKEATKADLQDHRLMIMLFDFSSMQPAEQIRTVNAAVKFLGAQMTSSDLVSVMVFGSDLQTVQDFTDDRDLLVSTVKRFQIGEGSELATMADTGADAEDQSGMYVADDTEFNIFNTDRKLAALEDAARKLARYPQKKALVYFSSGVEKTGLDNQSQLRATINTAVRSNVAFYPIDARGLTAAAGGGDATQAGAVGSNLYSGAGQRSLRDSFQNQQETLDSLAADTGGKTLLDSNDLTLGLTQVQKDIKTYYMLTYSSSNPAEDGRYRRIQVKLAPKMAGLKAKLEYRPGYFGPTTFARMNGADKDSQLQQALDSENPVTDLPIAVEVDYFRLAKSKYFVPVSMKIPGSALLLRKKGSKQATELDFITQVRDEHNRIAAVVRDTIPIKVDETTAGQVTRKQVQYDTGLTLAPGKYKLRCVARENGDGKIGTFETPFVVPDLSSGSALRLSSVIISNQRQAMKDQIAGAKNDKKLLAQNPLIDKSGQKLVPNVTRAFRPGQSLYVYLEVYDPTVPEVAALMQRSNQSGKFASIAADLAVYDGKKKLIETPAVRVNRLDSDRDNVAAVNLGTALKNLKPGQYVCQVNIIDELGRKVSFPRTSFVMLPPLQQPPAVQ